MLRCKVNSITGGVMVRAKGPNVATETLALIKTIYMAILQKNPVAADEYRRIIQAAMVDPKSPVFNIEAKEF